MASKSEIQLAISVLKEQMHKKGKWKAGTRDLSLTAKSTILDALTHAQCAECPWLKVTKNGNGPHLDCKSETHKPQTLWRDKTPFDPPNCPDFSVAQNQISDK